jgi:hypothetical protein
MHRYGPSSALSCGLAQVFVLVLVHGYENFYYYQIMLEEVLKFCDVCGKTPPVSREEFWAMPLAERRRVLITFFLDTGCQFAAFWKRCELAVRCKCTFTHARP